MYIITRTVSLATAALHYIPKSRYRRAYYVRASADFTRLGCRTKSAFFQFDSSPPTILRDRVYTCIICVYGGAVYVYTRGVYIRRDPITSNGEDLKPACVRLAIDILYAKHLGARKKKTNGIRIKTLNVSREQV